MKLACSCFVGEELCMQGKEAVSYENQGDYLPGRPFKLNLKKIKVYPLCF